MANILGISIGSRSAGFAVLKNGELADYRMRTFKGRWSLEKLESIWDVVERAIKLDGINTVMVKVPPPSHCSEHLIELIGGISSFRSVFGIEVHKCTMRDLRHRYSGFRRCSKLVLVDALILRHPELAKEWKDGTCARPYCMKLFEAVACADLAQSDTG